MPSEKHDSFMAANTALHLCGFRQISGDPAGYVYDYENEDGAYAVLHRDNSGDWVIDFCEELVEV